MDCTSEIRQFPFSAYSKDIGSRQSNSKGLQVPESANKKWGFRAQRILNTLEPAKHLRLPSQSILGRRSLENKFCILKCFFYALLGRGRCHVITVLSYSTPGPASTPLHPAISRLRQGYSPTYSALQRNFDLCNPGKGSCAAWVPISIYSQDRSTYFPAAE